MKRIYYRNVGVAMVTLTGPHKYMTDKQVTLIIQGEQTNYGLLSLEVINNLFSSALHESLTALLCHLELTVAAYNQCEGDPVAGPSAI